MYYNKNNINLYYEKHGNKGPILFILPGWGDTRKTFDFFISNLKTKYQIYIFDYPGFGKSIFPDCNLTIYDYALLFKSFLEEKKIKNPIILAHSFGARIAILLTGYYQLKAKKMILIGAAGIKPRKTIKQKLRQTLYKCLKKICYLLPKVYRNRYQKWLFQKFSSTDYRALDPKMMPTFRNVIHENLTKYLKNIKIETLLIWGEYDYDTPLKDGKRMEKEIEDSALITISHATHYCYLEQSILILQIINSFLEEKKETKIS